MLVKEGFKVECIFATVGELNYKFLKALAKLSPDTKIYSNLSPTMLMYEKDDIDCYIGSDCLYYFPEKLPLTSYLLPLTSYLILPYASRVLLHR